MLEILNALKEASWVPAQWDMTLISTIFKNKGSRKVSKKDGHQTSRDRGAKGPERAAAGMSNGRDEDGRNE